MKKARRKKAVILVAIAVIVIAALLVAFLLPALTRSPLQKSGMISEYNDSETTLKSPSSYKDLLQTIKKHKRSSVSSSDDGQNGEPLQLLPETGTGTNSTAVKSSDIGTRSTTASGSDEVKTDGRYLYSVFSETGNLTIIDTKDKMKIAYKGLLLPDETYQFRAFYVNGDTLYFTGCRKQSGSEPASEDSSSFLLTFDISDRANPVHTDTYEQSGQYLTSRLTDNTFYLFTNYYNYEPNETSVPVFSGAEIACEDIYYGKYFDQANYYCIGTVDLKAPGICAENKAILSTSSEFSVSDTSIFVISSDWIETDVRKYCSTNIVSIGAKGTSLTGKAIGSVPGFINDNFSINAYNGCLRLFTTQKETSLKDPTAKETSIGSAYTQSCALWVLNEQLQLLSSLQDNQKLGDVQSVRFSEDTVYFLTNSPASLLGADLSNPSSPQMLQDISLNGFSDHLRSWTDQGLLGLGYETDASGMPTGIKLCMYDNRNPAKITESSCTVFDFPSIVLGTDYSENALFTDSAKQLIGFAAQSYRYDAEQQFEGTTGTYYVFSYNPKKGFEIKIEAPLYEDNYWTNYLESAENRTTAKETPELSYQHKSIHNVRGLTVGNSFCIVHPEVAVYQYDINSFKLQGTLSLYTG